MFKITEKKVMITPEAKAAKEIFDSFNRINMSVSTKLQHERAKQCSLIAIEMLLKSTRHGQLNPLWKFRNDVKNIIEKM